MLNSNGNIDPKNVTFLGNSKFWLNILLWEKKMKKIQSWTSETSFTRLTQKIYQKLYDF